MPTTTEDTHAPEVERLHKGFHGGESRVHDMLRIEIVDSKFQVPGLAL